MKFFTADHHFGHQKIIAMCARPHLTVEQMDEDLIAKWNEVVQPEDEVFHLGDFVVDKKMDAGRIWNRLNGIKHLVTGNHDHKSQTMNLDWETVSQIRETNVGGQRIVMCHYPMLEWPGMYHGSKHLFGHVHGNKLGMRGSTDVRVDYHDFYPVTWEQASASIDRDIEQRILQAGCV